jgi:hypothetical protein
MNSMAGLSVWRMKIWQAMDFLEAKIRGIKGIREEILEKHSFSIN